ncbi:MAG: redoxin domain-containing protein [Ectothiorhodospiraceae bacterium]|nr:redoxin domain-containing protein [Ectothiorhodospiraceae bacterium]
MLKAGDKAPDFELKSHEGQMVSLAQYRGKWVVLHTFPLAFTGG